MKQMIRSFAWWLLANVKPKEDEVDYAIRQAFGATGLNLDKYSPEFDLMACKKFHDVFVGSCRNLGLNYSTVADIKKLLK